MNQRHLINGRNGSTSPHSDDCKERLDQLEAHVRRLWGIVQSLQASGKPPSANGAHRLLRIDAGPSMQQLLDCLSPRERQIIVRFAEAQTDKRIAGALGTRVQTVRNQIASIARKLNTDSREQLRTLVLKAQFNDTRNMVAR